MPWTISTEGLPLKKEIWSGSCLDGDSGAGFTASLCSLLLCAETGAAEDFFSAVVSLNSSYKVKISRSNS